MTSIILAQKMLKVIFSTSEFNKIKELQIDNKNRQADLARTLNVIQNKKKSNTCRLCLMYGKIYIFDTKNDIDYVAAIKTILDIEVTKYDGKPQHLCEACEGVLRSVQQLRQTADITQWRLDQEIEMVRSHINEANVEENDRDHGYIVQRKKIVQREWTCGNCKKTFTNKDSFTKHDQNSNCRERKKTVCDICGLKVESHRIKFHMSKHSDRKYSCEHCSYQTYYKGGMVTHMNVHMGLRPLKCSFCPATFVYASMLTNHRKRHFPPKHGCPMCDESFRLKARLRDHILSKHSDVKAHKCSLCEKAFPTSGTRYSHERLVHKREIKIKRLKRIIPDQEG